MSTIDKISALLAKAEASDNEHERDAFMSKAQELSTLCQIDLELARQRQADKTKREAPVKVSTFLLEHEVPRLRQHFVDLAYVIAGNNSIKMLYWPTSKKLRVNLFGFPSDIEVLQLLFSSLAVQMISAADAYIKTGAYKGETYETYDKWGYREDRKVDARVARNQFYGGFVSAIRSRLHEARQQAMQSADNTPTPDDSSLGAAVGSALVLKSRTDEVNEFYKVNVGKVSSASVNRSTRYGGSAGSAGKSAGNNARLSSSKGISSRAGAIA